MNVAMNMSASVFDLIRHSVRQASEALSQGSHDGSGVKKAAEIILSSPYSEAVTFEVMKKYQVGGDKTHAEILENLKLQLILQRVQSYKDPGDVPASPS